MTDTKPIVSIDYKGLSEYWQANQKETSKQLWEWLAKAQAFEKATRDHWHASNRGGVVADPKAAAIAAEALWKLLPEYAVHNTATLPATPYQFGDPEQGFFKRGPTQNNHATLGGFGAAAFIELSEKLAEPWSVTTTPIK